MLILKQAKEMVNEILRERDHPGFGDRNEYGTRMGGGGGGGGGGGIDVSNVMSNSVQCSCIRTNKDEQQRLMSSFFYYR